MPRKGPRLQQGIQSIEVGNELLGVLAAASQPLMLKDVAAGARMSAPKAHRYLVSYMRLGLVEQEADSGRYGLGEFALRLGLAALGRSDPVTAAASIMRDLAAEIDQTVAVAIWANHGATFVRWAGVDAPVSATLRVGSVMPLSRSATGLLFLACLPERRWSALLKAELAGNVRQRFGPQSQAELQPTLERIRRQGYSRTSEFIPGITGIAVPVFGFDNTLALALVALGYSVGFEAEETKIRTALQRSAQQLSRRLGAEPAASGG
ncbi:MAG: IclR family transcriptional regulator [Steroidobacteraceae bacterium]